MVRALWVLVDSRWVFGVSVPRALGASVRRAAGSVWPNAVVERWPVDDTKEVSDRVPIGEGGGTVIRRFLMPEVLSRLLRSPERVPDHPMARVLDVAADHPGVDVQLRVDVASLSPVDRDRICQARLEDLGEHDPDRGLWEDG